MLAKPVQSVRVLGLPACLPRTLLTLTPHLPVQGCFHTGCHEPQQQPGVRLTGGSMAPGGEIEDVGSDPDPEPAPLHQHTGPDVEHYTPDLELDACVDQGPVTLSRPKPRPPLASVFSNLRNSQLVRGLGGPGSSQLVQGLGEGGGSLHRATQHTHPVSHTQHTHPASHMQIQTHTPACLPP